MSRSHALLLITLLVGLAGASCTKPEPPADIGGSRSVEIEPSTPTGEEAHGLIEESGAFGDYDFTWASLSLPLSRSIMHQETRAQAEALERAGWIRFEEDEIALTDQASQDRRFLVRPNGFVDIVPLARKELVEVSSVEPRNGNALVRFTWRWIPNEIGEQFDSGPVHERFAATHRAAATLIRSGEGWVVLLIELDQEPR